MRVHVINTGTELLLGQVTNTHLAYLAERLRQRGLRVEKQICVPDGSPIRDALLESARDAELILVTGGLGPTSDDITRDIVAELAAAPLEHHEDIMEFIAERFRKRSLVITERIARQAQVPRGAQVLWNDWGTAPGLYLHPGAESGPLSGKHIILLPGPPRELKPVFETRVEPLLALIHPLETPLAQRNFRVIGMGESQVEDAVGTKIEHWPGLELGYCARIGEVDVRLMGTPEVVERAGAEVTAALGDAVISEAGESFEEVLVRLLTASGETLATAESCTGGLLANRITNVPGSSSIYLGGFVTYANSVKTGALGVPAEMLAEWGAVSAPVATAMAEGALAATGATYALSTTGIAGPVGGTETKPVGTVYMALAQVGHPTKVQHHYYPFDRETFKYAVAQRAFDLLRRRIIRVDGVEGNC